MSLQNWGMETEFCLWIDQDSEVAKGLYWPFKLAETLLSEMSALAQEILGNLLLCISGSLLLFQLLLWLLRLHNSLWVDLLLWLTKDISDIETPTPYLITD